MRISKNQVDNAISMLDAVYAGYETATNSYEEAETRGADLLRELRYGDGGYFWADTYDGDNVVLLGSETEGTNRMETKDADGYQMVKEIIRVGQEPDGGYTDYVFPKEGETESSPKRSYSRAFEPFGWVVGTGNYIDYIDETVAKETQAMKENVKCTACDYRNGKFSGCDCYGGLSLYGVFTEQIISGCTHVHRLYYKG